MPTEDDSVLPVRPNPAAVGNMRRQSIADHWRSFSPCRFIRLLNNDIIFLVRFSLFFRAESRAMDVFVLIEDKRGTSIPLRNHSSKKLAARWGTLIRLRNTPFKKLTATWVTLTRLIWARNNPLKCKPWHEWHLPGWSGWERTPSTNEQQQRHVNPVEK
jgi:hypothetical protein